MTRSVLSGSAVSPENSAANADHAASLHGRPHQPTPHNSHPHSATPTVHYGPLGWAIAIVAVLVGLLALALRQQAAGPEHVAENFLRSVISGDRQEMLRLVHPSRRAELAGEPEPLSKPASPSTPIAASGSAAGGWSPDVAAALRGLKLRTTRAYRHNGVTAVGVFVTEGEAQAVFRVSLERDDALAWRVIGLESVQRGGDPAAAAGSSEQRVLVEDMAKVLADSLGTKVTE